MFFVILSINLHQLIQEKFKPMLMKYLSKCLLGLYPSSCIPLLPLPIFICFALQLSYKFPKEGCIFCVLLPAWLIHFWAIKQSNKRIEFSRATCFTSHTAEFPNFVSRKTLGKEVYVRRSKHRQHNHHSWARLCFGRVLTIASTVQGLKTHFPL